MMTPPSTDPQQVAMGRTMQWMMPIMIGWISVGFPSGLSIYWVIANVVGFAQYAAMGKASLKNLYGTEDGSFSWRGLLGIPGPTQAQPVDRLKERSKSRKSSSKSSDKSSKSKQEQSEEK
jgi:membrane protein insertase Oxa1/YidC/SpoIIIJ